MIARITAARRVFRFCATPGCSIHLGQRPGNLCAWCAHDGARVAAAIVAAIARRDELARLTKGHRR